MVLLLELRPVTWFESRWPLEATRLLADPVYRRDGVTPEGQRCCSLTRFLADETSQWVMKLGAPDGYRVAGGRMRANVELDPAPSDGAPMLRQSRATAAPDRHPAEPWGLLGGRRSPLT